MHATSSDVQPSMGLEPIPGYVLEKRIGTGGYGEVWRASAPGGLSKAVKFVFGNLDEARAGREQRSLGRIKGLQHPFLLSLERIEVIDGKLMIVTELARCSLKDRYDECSEKQLKGIPRDELLVYLRDAADALDYLCEEHSLQHLDVKPENLLLVGSHVKVSDFGLVKDLTDTKSLSLVDGLTPKYSPPEILDNRPGRNSDQYSLAIVYQEMLTGELPFTGTTTAQLASQHVHATPDLSPLPPSDRFAVRKALSKNPESRFQSCREFVDYLINPPRIASVVASGGHPDLKTKVGEKSSNGAYIHDGRTQVIDTNQAKAMPALNVDGKSFKHKPTLFVGIGGIACRILHRLGQRLDDRYGGLVSVPAVQMLMLDTDVESINALAASDSNTQLNSDSMLALPLRNPQEYRRAHIDELQSISRRWLYNIPRSRKTEGLRALGRLAFLDHSALVLERLRKAVQELASPDSVTESAEHTRLTFEPAPPRVFIIASTSGGTGGGMLLDVGYALRQTLAEECLSDENVHGLLLHTTPHNARSQGLAFANTNAVLEELLYFARPDTTFPGEPSLQLAGFREDSLAFPNTYVIPLGDGISSDELNLSIDRVAEYIYLNCAASAGAFFEMCRHQDTDEADPTGKLATVRTFGIHALSETNTALPSRFGDYICKVLVTTWRGGPTAKVDERPQKLSELQGLASLESDVGLTRDIEEAASQFLIEERITEEQLCDQVNSLVRDVLQGNPEDYFERVVSDSISVDRGASTIDVCAIMLETIMGAEVSRESSQLGVESLPVALAEPLKSLAREKGQSLARKALRLANVSATRVEGARHAAYCLVANITSLRNHVAETTKAQAKLEATALKESLQTFTLNANGSRRGATRHRKEATKKLIEYALARLHEVVLSSVCDLLRMMDLTVTTVADDLRDFWQDLTLLKNHFQHVDGNVGRFADRDLQRQWDCLLERQQELVKQLDELSGVCLVDQHDQLARQLFEGDKLEPFVLKLRRTARRLTLGVLKVIQRDTLHDLIAGESSWAESLLSDVNPELAAIGGEKRLLLTSSEDLDAKRLADCLQNASGEEVTIVKDGNQDCVICYEVGGLRLRNVANYLIKHRSDYVEMSRRLRTRIDIDFG